MQTFTRQIGAAVQVSDLHELQQRLLANGICVNGCGPLTATDNQNRHCPACGFRHSAFPQFSTATDFDGQLVKDPHDQMQRAYAAGVCPRDGHDMVSYGEPNTTQCVLCAFQHFNFIAVPYRGQRW